MLGIDVVVGEVAAGDLPAAAVGFPGVLEGWQGVSPTEVWPWMLNRISPVKGLAVSPLISLVGGTVLVERPMMRRLGPSGFE